MGSLDGGGVFFFFLEKFLLISNDSTIVLPSRWHFCPNMSGNKLTKMIGTKVTFF